MTGMAVKKLMECAEDIFNDLEAITMDAIKENQVLVDNVAAKEQLSLMHETTKLALQAFDGLFGILRTQPTNLQTDMQQASHYLATAMQLWRRLGMEVTPKAHLLEDHAVNNLESEGNLEHRNEEFVEFEHQEGDRFDKTMRGAMKNPARRFNLMSRLEKARKTLKIKKSNRSSNWVNAKGK